MKSLMEIATNLNLRYNKIVYYVKVLKIVPTKKKRMNKSYLYLDQYQEDILLDHLFIIGVVKELIFESKMNN